MMVLWRIGSLHARDENESWGGSAERAADRAAHASSNLDKLDQRGVHDSVVGAIGRWILSGVLRAR